MLGNVDTASGKTKPTAGCLHNAADLLWTDGLESIRQLFAKDRYVDTGSQPLGSSFGLSTLQDVAWYCTWQGHAGDTTILQPVPKVQVSEVCRLIGVPVSEQPKAVQQLRRPDLQLLQQTVLPEYLMGVVIVLDTQLPGLDIAKRHKQDELFIRLASLRGEAAASNPPIAMTLIC